MTRTLLTCDGAAIESVRLPPFQLRAGDFCCLHMPGRSDTREEQAIIDVLTGKKATSGIKVLGRIVAANPALPAHGWRRFFARDYPEDWLTRAAPLSRQAAAAITARLGLSDEHTLAQLAMNPRSMLGLEAAWAQGAEAVIFRTVGCDPLGEKTIFEMVVSHIATCAAIHLNYPFLFQEQLQRACHPAAICIPLMATSGAEHDYHAPRPTPTR